MEWHILAARLSDPLAESLRGRPLSEAPPAVARLLEALQLWLTSATAAAHGHGGANASRSTTVGSSGAIWHGRDDTLAQVNDAHAAWRQLIADGKDATKRRLYGEADVAKCEKSASSSSRGLCLCRRWHWHWPHHQHSHHRSSSFGPTHRRCAGSATVDPSITVGDTH